MQAVLAFNTFSEFIRALEHWATRTEETCDYAQWSLETATAELEDLQGNLNYLRWQNQQLRAIISHLYQLQFNGSLWNRP